MGAKESTPAAARNSRFTKKVDPFVRRKLKECNCESVLPVFVDNEIDEAAFLLLSENDLKTLLPDKLGPRIKIWALIQTLQYEQALLKGNYIGPTNKSIDACSETSKDVNNEPQIHSTNDCVSIASAPVTSSYNLLPPISQPQAVNNEVPISVRDDISSSYTAEPSTSLLNVFASTAEEQRLSSTLDANIISVTPSELQALQSFNIPGLTEDHDDFDTSMENVETKTNYSAVSELASKALSYVLENPAEVYDTFLKPILKSSDSECRDHSFNEPILVDNQFETRSYPDKANFEIGKHRKSYGAEKPSGRPHSYRKETETNQSTEPKGKHRHSVDRKYGRPSSDRVPIPHKIIESRKKLPIYEYKNELLNIVNQNSVVIVIAETGSGKSTQIPQYLAKANYDKKIVCTQPRRLAAKSLARRVALEYGSKLGTGVGYRVRFDNCTENTTKISYVTEGVLIHELVMDVTASNYSVVIIDEAHERNLNTDVLLGCLKKAVASRPDLKLIISSATVEAFKFSTFFNDAPILNIPGRSYPVEVFYTGKPNPDYLNGVVHQVCCIHKAGPGDILVFLPGQEDIEYVAETLTSVIRECPNPFLTEMVLPLYSRLPAEQQNMIFEPAPQHTRKIILATNIAETSLTIDGIVFVVDSGLVKQAEYTTKANSKALECTTLVTIPITRAQAKQRSGRAGRTQPGKAYRLYSEETYNHKMAESPVPEILRGNLEMVVLLLFSMGVKNILEFDFLDSPPKDALLTALEKLQEFGALIRSVFGEYKLTSIGRQMSFFPIEPYLSKMLIMSADLGCSEEMLTIIAMLSAQVEKLFKRPKAKRMEADLKKKSFHCDEGDHITLLNVYNQWLGNRGSRGWCTEYFLNWRTLDEVFEIRCQLSTMLDEKNIARRSCGDDVTKIQIAIASGSFRKIAWKSHKYAYYTFSNPTDEPVLIHPSSVLFSRSPDLVIYNSVIKTKKAYMNQVLEIKREYIEEYAGSFYPKLQNVMPY